MVDRLTTSIREGIGFADARSVRGVADVSTTSLEAYRAFAEGVEAANNYRFEDARKSLDRAVSIDPAFAEAHLELANATNALGRRDLWVEHLRKASDHSDRLSDRDRLLLRIESARAGQNFVESARALDQLIAEFPDSDAAYDMAAQLYHPVVGALPSVDKALAFGKAGVTALPLSTVARFSYAISLFAAGRTVEALREFETYARLAPRESEPHFGMASTYQVMGILDKALESWDAALRIHPDLASLHQGRSGALAMIGRYDEALAEIPPMQIAKALYLSRVGRYREAQQVLGTITTAELKSDAMPQPTHMTSALLAIERKAYARALTECDAADKFRERLPEQWRRSSLLIVSSIRGVAEARSGRVPQAIAQLDVARRTQSPTVPRDNYYRVLEGEIALARGDLDGAAEAFTAAEPATRAFQFSPGFGNNPPFRDGLARVAAARGDRRGAIAIYRRLLTHGPDQKFLAYFEPLYVFEIARLLDQLGDKPEALKEYVRFLEFWKNADANLPELAQARRAVERLSRSG
jgi:tetratricopeptide (TPR) repeat protein